MTKIKSSDSVCMILCLVYRNYSEVAEYLDMILGHDDKQQLRVIVVDNTPGSPAGSVEWLSGCARAASRWRPRARLGAPCPPRRT